MFLIYNLNSEMIAEAMYNGIGFLTENKNVTYAPVFVNFLTDQKSSLTFQYSIPTENVRNLEHSNYNGFQLQESDLPIAIVYNEQNDFCGYARNVDDLTKVECLNEVPEGQFLRLKVLVQNHKKQVTAYSQKPVVVLNATKTTTLSVLETNEFGDFDYLVTDQTQDYVLQVPGKQMEDVEFVILSTQGGREVGKFAESDYGFQYKLLKADLARLPDLQNEDDIDLQLTDLEHAKTKEFIITEALFYELGKTDLLPVSKALLDRLILVMKVNKKFNLMIISHTDSQGDDGANLRLSTQRSQSVMNYFVSKGIGVERLTGSGKGETEIRNRCGNGVRCSDKEHEYNRRTEFRFIKD